MIFTGSMQEMRRRLCRHDFTLELEGAAADVRRLAREAGNMEGIEAHVSAGQALLVRVADGRSRSGALADVLKLVEAGNLSLQAIHSGQNATENAYLQLLQEDEAHGFQR
jgi:hypothetical protein